MTAVFLGAGFSKWAANLPVVNQLFDLDIGTTNQRDENRLRAFSSFKAKWDAEHPSVHPEEFIRHVLCGPKGRQRLLLWYITRRLSDPFIAWISGGNQTLMIDDRRATENEGVAKARKFLHSLEVDNLSGIVTCNYDLIVEYALGTSGFNYGVCGEQLSGRGKNPCFPWHFPNPILRGNIPLAKLHGSISWDHQKRYTDGRCGMNGTALIVPPVPEKEPMESMRPTWELAAGILKRSTKLIVFGFAFNSYDKAVLTFLKENGVNLRSVRLIDIQSRADAALKLWPKARITTDSPP